MPLTYAGGPGGPGSPWSPYWTQISPQENVSFETLFRVLKLVPIQIDHFQNSMSISRRH